MDSSTLVPILKEATIMIIPQYLSNFAKNSKKSKDGTSFDLSCQCGCSQFLVYKNKLSKDEQEANDRWEALKKRRFDRGNVSFESDEEGNVFVIKKNFFGRITDKARVNDIPCTDTNVFKAECSMCGMDIILFNNQIHGYDAVVEGVKKDTPGIEFTQIKFKGSTDSQIKLNINIFNDRSLEEYNCNADMQATPEEYSNVFSEITIYGFVVDLNNKKVIIHSEETR
jgi:hypothetical protein